MEIRRDEALPRLFFYLNFNLDFNKHMCFNIIIAIFQTGRGYMHFEWSGLGLQDIGLVLLSVVAVLVIVWPRQKSGGK